MSNTAGKAERTSSLCESGRFLISPATRRAESIQTQPIPCRYGVAYAQEKRGEIQAAANAEASSSKRFMTLWSETILRVCLTILVGAKNISFPLLSVADL